MEEYSEFANIVICLYDNSEVGKALANGVTRGFGNEVKQKSWLAMYTYNPVEGSYFDSNPGAYLGAY